MAQEWYVSPPYYGLGDTALQKALNELGAADWRVLQIIEPHLAIIAYRETAEQKNRKPKEK